jgi:hypothetical protein
MGCISGRSDFVDYRATGSGVAILPYGSVVVPSKDEARNLEHIFGTIQQRIDDGGTLSATSVIIRELKWS